MAMFIFLSFIFRQTPVAILSLCPLSVSSTSCVFSSMLLYYFHTLFTYVISCSHGPRFWFTFVFYTPAVLRAACRCECPAGQHCFGV